MNCEQDEIRPIRTLYDILSRFALHTTLDCVE